MGKRGCIVQHAAVFAAGGCPRAPSVHERGSDMADRGRSSHDCIDQQFSPCSPCWRARGECCDWSPTAPAGRRRRDRVHVESPQDTLNHRGPQGQTENGSSGGDGYTQQGRFQMRPRSPDAYASALHTVCIMAARPRVSRQRTTHMGRGDRRSWPTLRADLNLARGVLAECPGVEV